MIVLRKILFYLFLLLYVVLCPLIIFYALGYIFSPRAEEGIVQTGMIYVESLPSKAVVTLNRKKMTEMTPATMSDLTSGMYELSVSSPGYRVWSKTVGVEAGKATILDRILLLPADISKSLLAVGPYDDMWPLSGTRYFVVSAGDRLGTFGVVDWADESLRSLLDPGSPHRDDRVVGWTHVPNSDRVLIEVLAKGARRFLWLRVDKRKTQVTDITAWVPAVSDVRFFWDSGADEYLFAYSDGALSLLNLRGRKTYPRFTEDVYGYGVAHGKVYLLKNSRVFSMEIAGKPRKLTVVEDADFIRHLFDADGEYFIRGVSDEITVLKGARGEFFVNRPPYRLAEEGVLGHEFLKKSEFLLIWKKDALGLVDMAKSRSPGRFFEPGLQAEWIRPGLESIVQALWVNEGAQVLLCTSTGVYVMDVALGYDDPPEKILTVKTGSAVFYSDETGKIYYLDRDTGHLMAAKLLPDERFLTRTIIKAIEDTASEIEKAAPARGISDAV